MAYISQYPPNGRPSESDWSDIRSEDSEPSMPTTYPSTSGYWTNADGPTTNESYELNSFELGAFPFIQLSLIMIIVLILLC